VRFGLVPSLARPGTNATGIEVLLRPLFIADEDGGLMHDSSGLN
jgi:hypothetical protein